MKLEFYWRCKCPNNDLHPLTIKQLEMQSQKKIFCRECGDKMFAFNVRKKSDRVRESVESPSDADRRKYKQIMREHGVG